MERRRIVSRPKVRCTRWNTTVEQSIRPMLVRSLEEIINQDWKL